MGTSSITINTPEDKLEYTQQKDAKTTTVSLGMRITGYIVKDANGAVTERVTKPFDSIKEEHFP